MKTARRARPGRIAVAALCLLFAAEVARTLTTPRVGNLAAWYVAFFAPFIILFMAVLWHPDLPPRVLHLYLLLQCALTGVLLALNPEIDFVTSLFDALAYQVALIFVGRTRWTWVAVLALSSPLSLMILLGPVRGLALGLSGMAFAIILPALVAVNEELEQARAGSQALLAELEETHRQLETYAGQVQELAAIQERGRLACELHDSVSQTLFSIILNTRSAQILLEREPARLPPQLELLQGLALNALAEMRGLIARLRPSGASNQQTE